MSLRLVAHAPDAIRSATQGRMQPPHTPRMLGISFSSHGELGHHAGILVLQNVTVRHIRSGSVRRMREAHKDFGYTAGRDRGDVLPAGALGFRRLAVPREDAELTAMDVNGV